MKAATMYGPKDLRLENVDIPSIQGNAILVKVKACGVCGSDVHTYKSGAIAEFGRHMILGHEFSGEVTGIGDAVKGIAIGDRVLGSGFRTCGKCRWCQQGQALRCSNIAVPGHGMDGAFAEYLVVPNPMLGKQLFKIPESLSWEEATMVEPMSVSCYAVEQAMIKPSDTVVVLGAGVIGLGVAQMAKAKGAAKVVVSEPASKRLDIAKKLGADVALNPKETDVVEVVREATSHDMAAVVFECSGSPVAFRQAIQITRAFGTVMQVGVFERSVELEPSLMSQWTTTNLTLRGSGGRKWDKALELVLSGGVKTKEMITHYFSLDNAREAFETQANSAEAIKVMIRP